MDHVKVTTTADRTAEVGKPFGDTAHITGTVPKGAHITFKLSHKGLLPNTCGDVVVTTKPVAVPAGNYTQPIDIASAKVTVEEAGTYVSAGLLNGHLRRGDVDGLGVVAGRNRDGLGCDDHVTTRVR